MREAVMTRAAAVVIACAALVVSVTGCSSSAKKAVALSSSLPQPPATTAVTTAPAPTVPTVAPSTPASSTPAQSTTTKPSPPASSAAPRSTCTSVSVRVIRGSASLGQEIAALQFTNDGTRACVLVGFPIVTLLRKGQQLGNPSLPSSPGSVSKRTLAPGDTAESVLHDYTQTCNSALSDSLRVQVPGSSITAIRPAELRGCILRVDKLGPPQ
jgi:hypothetical protein